MTWFNRVTNDISQLPDFIAYYEGELLHAKKEVIVFGNVEKNIATLPGITECRFNQLQEIEAILNYLNIQYKKIRRKYFQMYLEGYHRALTPRDAEKYADGEGEVTDYEAIINEVSLIRNKYLGVIKALESKNFMLGHLVRLRVAGMEDISIG
jgi:hypothetical protein